MPPVVRFLSRSLKAGQKGQCLWKRGRKQHVSGTPETCPAKTDRFSNTAGLLSSEDERAEEAFVIFLELHDGDHHHHHRVLSCVCIEIEYFKENYNWVHASHMTCFHWVHAGSRCTIKCYDNERMFDYRMKICNKVSQKGVRKALPYGREGHIYYFHFRALFNVLHESIL